MIVVLAEKPSAARNFAEALGGMQGSRNGQQYRIVALRGHVVGFVEPHLQVPDGMAEAMRAWDLSSLPWDRSALSWRMAVLPGCEEVIDSLKGALRGADEVAIATDDDPTGEGELLAWEALSWCGWSGPTTRMHFTDETPSCVQAAFDSRAAIPSMEADGDYAKALARCKWDFLSMQLTRAATCAVRQRGYRALLRQGRLKSVITWMVGSQLAERAAYVKKPFYEARFRDANGNVFKRAEPERFATEAEAGIGGYHPSGIVEDSREERSTAPGRLIDLMSLASILAPKGFASDEVLATYQKMYQDGIVSYPRTEDKTITPGQFAEFESNADAIASLVGVDASMLTHRQPRGTHVKEKGAHGANRPGPNLPKSVESLASYGPSGPAIYELLARSCLAMLAEDCRYILAKGHLADYPDFLGEAHLPVFAGFKAVFDAEAAHADAQDGEKEGKGDFAGPAEPYVHQGANKKPQNPTMKWLRAQLERYEVGTAATRVSVLDDMKATGDESALLTEKKGVLGLTDCGTLSFCILEGCMIANPKRTEELLASMERIGRFEEGEEELLASIDSLVAHDLGCMVRNAASLPEANPAAGTCPVCGRHVVARGRTWSCESNKSRKAPDGSWEQVEGCGFTIYPFCGVALSLEQASAVLSGGKAALKGCKSKSTGRKFDCEVSLDPDGHGLVPHFDVKPPGAQPRGAGKGKRGFKAIG